MSTDNKLYQIEYYNKIVPKEIEWLWYPYIPYGKITIIQGDPGQGKSTVAIHLASLVSNGDLLPLSTERLEQSIVVYQNNKDGKEDTIVPRLISNKANLNNVAYIEEKENSIELGDCKLEKAIEETSARLIILDPIQAYFGDKTDMNRASDIRPIMNRLAKVAQEKNCAVILIGHLTKNNNGKGLYRGLGSIDIGAAARSILLVSKLNEKDKIISHLKSNLAPKGESIVFNINKDSTIKWIRHSSLTADQIINEDYEGDHTKLQQATELILECLAENINNATEIKNACYNNNISERTINNAKRKLEIISYKQGNMWFWKRNH